MARRPPDSEPPAGPRRPAPKRVVGGRAGRADAERGGGVVRRRTDAAADPTGARPPRRDPGPKRMLDPDATAARPKRPARATDGAGAPVRVTRRVLPLAAPGAPERKPRTTRREADRPQDDVAPRARRTPAAANPAPPWEPAPPAPRARRAKPVAPAGAERAADATVPPPAKAKPNPRRAPKPAPVAAATPAEPPAPLPAPPKRLHPPQPLPSRDALRSYLAAMPERVGKGQIARQFGLGVEQRAGLRDLLRQLKAERARVGDTPVPDPVAPPAQAAEAPPEPAASNPAPANPDPDADAEAPPRRGRRTDADPLPETTIVEVTGTDPDGDPIARPVGWRGPGPSPVIHLAPERPGQPALAAGDRVLARLRRTGPSRYEGRSFKRIGRDPETAPTRILGVFEQGRIIPTDRRQKGEWIVAPDATGGASSGEIVLAEPLPSTRPLGPRPARIVERLGRMGEPRAISLICIHAHGIPEVFAAEAIEEAAAAGPIVASRWREDLRAIPLVTIDGEDARDFDDAVHAAPDGAGGWVVLVAIADVAHYVRPDSALDRAASERGNSVYFPDRVVPMLPEALSNGWCSLRPNEDRGCLFVEMRFDAHGTKTAHRFGRGLMRSAARLTYTEVQEAADVGAAPAGLVTADFAALYGAFGALLAARGRRGTLDLDLPERRVVLDAAGRVAAVEPRARLNSHKLIEEFMVAANVCAAEELERLGQPCMYRVHDQPSMEKLETLRVFLRGLDLPAPPARDVTPRDFAAILAAARGRAEERLVNETVLRSQAQAAYSPDNLGHFGLALGHYAHFTSPIRRYADLLVHRALIRGLRLGEGPLLETEAARFAATAEHITATERRAAQAERDAVDRYLAAWLADRIGERFPARISGVTRFGLFVTLDGNGASGIVPMASLPDDRWNEDTAARALVGSRTGRRFTLGDEVMARLIEATPRTGGMVFSLAPAGGAGVDPGTRRPGQGPRPGVKRGAAAKGRKPR